MKVGFDEHGPVVAAESDAAFRSSPALQEIKRLEAELRDTKQRYSDMEGYRDNAVKERDALMKKHAEAWGLNFLKAILRVVVILLWFALTVGCLATPWWALYHHVPMAAYYLWALFPGIVLGILFWLYIHEKT